MMMMTIKVKLIDLPEYETEPAMFISHRELARFVFAVEVEPTLDDKSPAYIQRSIQFLTDVLKRHAIRMAADEGEPLETSYRIVRSSFDAMLDAGAIHESNETYDWSAEVIDPLMRWLGPEGVEQVQMLGLGIDELEIDFGGVLVLREASPTIDEMKRSGLLAVAK